MNQAQITQVLRDHILVNFPAYSPLLIGEKTFRTLGGNTVTVLVRGGIATFNGASIVAADAITKNGVVHTIDRVY